MWKFQTIGLVGSYKSILVIKTLNYIYQLLTNWGITIILENKTAFLLKKKNGISIKKLTKNCDLIISVGGDGNLLSVARISSLYNVPVIGINQGKLGFLTDINPSDVHHELKEILKGKYIECKRFLIQGIIKKNNKKAIFFGNALNDIVLYSGESSHLIEFEVKINNKFVYTQRSDGIIIATPTGSTAYALSAGGPIIEPTMDALVLVPKFPHTLSNRPLLINASSKITLIIGYYKKSNPKISFDGQNNCEIKTGNIIHINKQHETLRLLHPKNYNYYQSLRNKLYWSQQLLNI